MNEPSEEFGQQPRPTEGTAQPAQNQVGFGPASKFAGQQLAEPSYSAQQPTVESQEKLSWQAAEYTQHSKGMGWVLAFLAGTVVLAVIAYISGGWSFLAVAIVMAGAFAFFAFRPPTMLDYSLSADTIQIQDKHYAYKDFRAFGIVHEGSMHSAVLIPVKRLGLAVRLSFGDDHADEIFDILNQHLPIQEMHEGIADKVMRSLRF